MSTSTDRLVTRLTRLDRVRAHRRTRSGDDGVALMTTLMAIMLVGMLSILVLGMVLAQRVPTLHLEASSKTVFAAEAGINAAIGQIRTAQEDVGSGPGGQKYGDTDKLPCTAQGPVEGATGNLTYDVLVRYYLDDPTGRDESWLAANAVGCTPGSGPAADPAYAVITSAGEGPGVSGASATTGDRTLQVVYEFQITNNNIPGGLIYSFDANIVPDTACLEAESATVGAYVTYVAAATCGSDDVHQLWIYGADYQIKLASTTLPTMAMDPLCITGPIGGGLPQKATLQVCKAPTDSARWNQLWSWEGGAKWTGQSNPISGGLSGIRLYSGATSGAPTGRYLHVGNVNPSDNEWGSFNPDPRVGAGGAGKSTNQIVNYLEFGRCTDVTDETVSRPYLIVYPCKQDPRPGSPGVLWNHKFYYDEPTDELGSRGPQQIKIREHDTTEYCLISPGTEGGYVTLERPCNSSQKRFKWTRNAETGSYGTSYTFVDDWGRCLSLGGDKHNNAWTKITTGTCNGSLAQKWNAPPHTIEASLDGYRELH